MPGPTKRRLRVQKSSLLWNGQNRCNDVPTISSRVVSRKSQPRKNWVPCLKRYYFGWKACMGDSLSYLDKLVCNWAIWLYIPGDIIDRGVLCMCTKLLHYLMKQMLDDLFWENVQRIIITKRSLVIAPGQYFHFKNILTSPFFVLILANFNTNR